MYHYTWRWQILKNKTILIYISLILITILSFAIPKIITNIQDKKILSDKYTISKKIHTLNENAKSVELIEKMYSKYNMDKYNVQVSDIVNAAETTIVKETEGDVNIQINDENIDYTLNKFGELIRQNIIRQDFFYQFSSKFITYRIWDYDNGKIQYKQVKIFTQDSLDEAIASMEIENETNKIIAYTVKKEYSEITQKVLLEYAQYLELYSISDDWEYRDNELKSKTAGIKIIGDTDDRYNYVKIVPLEE